MRLARLRLLRICITAAVCGSLASASYLRSFEAELLAPIAGETDFLWLSFETSTSDLFGSVEYHSVKVQEVGSSNRLIFSDCASVLEAPTWPLFVGCNAGIFQLDGVLRAGARYELVLSVGIGTAAASDTSVKPVALQLHIGHQERIPVHATSEITFFEKAVAPVDVEARTYPIGGLLSAGQAHVQDLQLLFPLTFVPVNISFPLQLALRTHGSAESDTGANVTVLILARPFTIWSLQPEGVEPVEIRGNADSASCLDQLTRVEPPVAFDCTWISYGITPGFQRRANGLKLVFHEPLPRPTVSISLMARSPAAGSFESWVAVTLERIAGTEPMPAPLKRFATVHRGVGVHPAPSFEMLSYTSRTCSELNTVRIRVQPGVILHGIGVSDETLSGYIKVLLPESTDQLSLCVIEPASIWGFGGPRGITRFLVRMSSSEKSCTFHANSPALHFFERSEYVLSLTFYNYYVTTMASENVWTIQLRSPGPLSCPAGTKHTYSLQQTFDVVSAVPLFRLAFSRLAVSERHATGPKNAVMVDIQMSNAEIRKSLGLLACMSINVPEGFSFGNASSCDQFQLLAGFPSGTVCSLESERRLRLVLPSGLSLMPNSFYSFAIQLWNPTALHALHGQDISPWELGVWHGTTCHGDLHATREGYTMAMGDWQTALYPLMGTLAYVSASLLTVGVEASAIVHFSMPAPLAAGEFLLVTAPRDFSWQVVQGSSPLATAASATGARASWTLWHLKVPPPVSLGDHPNELILTVGGAGIQPLIVHGIRGSIMHSSTADSVQSNQYWQAGRPEPRRWSIEAFKTTTGDRPPVGYRSNMLSRIPFRHRIAAAIGLGYELRSLASCQVLPWNNRPRQLTAVVIRFTPAVSVGISVARPPALKLQPPRPFVFKRHCEARLPVPLTAPPEVLTREPLDVSACYHETWDMYIWLVLSAAVVANNPYIVEVSSLEVPVETPARNTWSLAVLRSEDRGRTIPDTTLTSAAISAEESRCVGVPGFPVAMPLPRAELLTGGAAFRPKSASEITFVFGVLEPTIADFVLKLSGPLGARFLENCIPSLRYPPIPLTSAPIPGRIEWCLGSGGGTDRAHAQLFGTGADGGGFLPGDVYSVTLGFFNGPYIEGLPAESNSWRLQLSDSAWHSQDAVAIGMPSYDVTPPVKLDFLLSDQVSNDAYFASQSIQVNLTVRFKLTEALPAGIGLVLRAPPDSFEYITPCSLSHSDQLDWVPVVDPLPANATPTKEGSLLSSSVFTASCRPSCFSLVGGGLQNCATTSGVLNVTVTKELQASLPYCFAVLMKSPTSRGAGFWHLEFYEQGRLLEMAPPTTGPIAGALHLPKVYYGAPFVVMPSTRSRAARAVSLSVTFSLPILVRGTVTFLPPSVGGSLSQGNTVRQGTAAAPVLSRDTGLGRSGIPFFDFRDACAQIDGGIDGVLGSLPRPRSCAASSHALSITVLDSGIWQSFSEYHFTIADVPAGKVTGAVDLFSGDKVPDFQLMAIDTDGNVLAMGGTEGWQWVPELRITYLWMKRPLLDTPEASPVEVHIMTSSLLRHKPTRLQVQAPGRFLFQWASGRVPVMPPGAGYGPFCDAEPASDLSPCNAMHCRVTATREDGANIELPHCKISETSVGCCYGSGVPGQPVFVQLLVTASSDMIPPETKLQVWFAEVLTSSEHLTAQSSQGISGVETWNITTASLELHSCGSSSRLLQDGASSGSSSDASNASRTPTVLANASTTASNGRVVETTAVPPTFRGSNSSSAPNITITLVASTSSTSTTLVTSTTSTTAEECGGYYVVTDEVSEPSMMLYLDFRHAFVEPAYTTLSYDNNPVSFLFELPTTLPRFGSELRVTAPPGFVFNSIPFAIDEDHSPAILSKFGGRQMTPLPAGFVAELSGPILVLQLFPKLGGSLIENTVYGFVIRVNNPHVRPKREDNRWVLQTMIVTSSQESEAYHWAEADGFVLGGSVPQFEIVPSAVLPWYPTTVLDVSFMLSLPLPRAANLGSELEWTARDRASRLVLIAPEGFMFPANCEAPPLSDGGFDTALTDSISEATAAMAALGGERKALPPPWECAGSISGSYSNATLLLIPTDDLHSGFLVQDQLYRVRLITSNPLFDPGGRNIWQLMSLWGQTKDSFVVLHHEDLLGFKVQGMTASVIPASIEPAAFHLVNITFSPSNVLTPSADMPQLSSLMVVAPRGTELSCVGFLPGTVGLGYGVAGWVDAERIACSETEVQQGTSDSGACAWPGLPPPRGLWTLCLSFLTQPYWDTVVGHGSDNELWFAVPTVNPSYLPTDNYWALAVLGQKTTGIAVKGSNHIIDAVGVQGYGLVKRVG